MIHVRQQNIFLRSTLIRFLKIKIAFLLICSLILGARFASPVNAHHNFETEKMVKLEEKSAQVFCENHSSIPSHPSANDHHHLPCSEHEHEHCCKHIVNGFPHEYFINQTIRQKNDEYPKLLVLEQFTRESLRPPIV